VTLNMHIRLADFNRVMSLNIQVLICIIVKIQEDLINNKTLVKN